MNIVFYPEALNRPLTISKPDKLVSLSHEVRPQICEQPERSQAVEQ